LFFFSLFSPFSPNASVIQAPSSGDLGRCHQLQSIHGHTSTFLHFLLRELGAYEGILENDAARRGQSFNPQLSSWLSLLLAKAWTGLGCSNGGICEVGSSECLMSLSVSVAGRVCMCVSALALLM